LNIKTFRLDSKVSIQEILNGGITTLPASKYSLLLCEYARDLVESIFQEKIENISHKTYENNIDDFVKKSTWVKSRFTESNLTKELTRQLVRERYNSNDIDNMLFDKPRIRIIPNSNFLSSGISYNYKPHRDTWYGGTSRQVNHWMSLSNVTPDSTFYIAPSYFEVILLNNSEVFDLDTWDKKYRNVAKDNIAKEDRPHPVPEDEVPDHLKFLIIHPPGTETVFSAHHIHGSHSNTTDFVRFSIDYRTAIVSDAYDFPNDTDKKSTGNLENYMYRVNV
jgi:hypothetical protein